MTIFPTARLHAVCVAMLQLSAISAMAQQSPSVANQNPALPATVIQKANPQTEPAKVASTRPAEAAPILQQMNSALQTLVARISPAVVQILVTSYGALEESNRSETALIARQHAVGSGVIVDSDGYIITNAHVVQGARRIRVVLPMPSPDQPSVAAIGREHVFDAKIIGVHKETDLALLKIDQKGLPTLELGNGRRIHQGELVVALGSPEGLENSVTMGVVSSVGRQPDPDRPMVYIQTDAPINPGNSGGPLVDMDGYVVGINTLIVSQGGGSEGLGFAIPARVVRFVYQSLRTYGHVHRVEIEAAAQNITPALAEGLGLSQSYGVVISDVTPGGPAEAAGLKIGDIVVTADERRIDTLPGLTAAMYLHPLDEVMKLVVLRGTQKETLEIPVLEHRDPMDKVVDAVDPEKSLVRRLGILAVDLDPQLKSVVGDLRISSGVVVVARTADLLGPETDLRTGDVIHSVNSVSIDSLDSLRARLREIKPGAPVVLQVERDSKLEWVAFEME
ncbi:MAG: trypsin-like peptidase domain-containing protein [Terriglobales bacterium]|jgi:serine protease Do